MITALPGSLATGSIVNGWRIDGAQFAKSWDSGVGAQSVGGRWNPVGLKTVYCSVDPSTCIIEAAVHKKFKVLDTQPHVLTSIELTDLSNVRIVYPNEIPNPAWLHGGIPSTGQQIFGATLLQNHDFIFLPSAVSKMSWNIIFSPIRAIGKYMLRSQERLVMDTRLNPPT